jgi:hypothetical protein
MHKLMLLLAAGAAAVATGLLASTAGAAPIVAHRSVSHDLRVSNLWQEGNPPPAKLAARVTYHASLFPLPVRITPPDGSWAGAQWKDARHNKPPFYGFVALLQGPTNQPPLGEMFLVASYERTASVAATVARLRGRGTGVTFEAPTSVKLAGSSGIQLDGTVVGREHSFVPFTPPTHSARYKPDAVSLPKGTVFRIIVLGVRGKTVFVIVDNARLSPDDFPAFRDGAEALLRNTKFHA